MGMLDKITSKFKKKKKNTEDDVDVEVLDKSGGEKAKKSNKKGGAFGRFKKKIHIIVKRKNVNDAEAGEDGAKPKKAKKTKVKKEKKPKVKKEKKPKVKKDGDGEEDGKKIKPLMLIIIIGGGILVGVAAFLIITFVINRPTVEEQLLNAQLLVNEQKYDEATAIYQKLIKKDAALVDAYIGLADATVGSGDTDAAIQGLTEALIPTSDDPKIHEKIDALTPHIETETSDTAATSGVTSGPIVFKDASFEKLLRQALQKPSGDISEADLANITTLKILGDTHCAVDESLKSLNKNGGYEIDGVLYTERGTIKSLDDAAHIKKLRKLIVAYNAVEDISGIESLTSLETVGLYFNNIQNIEPLSKLVGLKYLYIYDNQIADISPLAQLTGMEQLWLNKNKITNISVVSGMSNLEELFISDNQISDLTPVSKLSGLFFLYADRNEISDLTPLKDMTLLSDVSFIDNPVKDYSPVSHVFNVNQPR